MQFNYVTLPSNITENRLQPNQFKVLVYLYSLVRRSTKCKVKVRQELIAKRCNLSISTVRRCTEALVQEGYIIGRYRSKKANGYLGTYTYYLQPIGDRKFRIDRTALRLESKLLRIYALFCKLANSETLWFYHSYSDLASLLGQKRSIVIALVESIEALGLIKKNRRVTTHGDFTENTYAVLIFRKSSSIGLGNSISLFIHFVKRCSEKISVALELFTRTVDMFYFYLWGGG